MKLWQLIIATPLLAFLAFFMFKATEASLYGSLRAPLYVALIYIVAFFAAKKLGWKWRKWAIVFLSTCHTCLSLSLMLRANVASNLAPLIPLFLLALAMGGLLAIRSYPNVRADAILHQYGVFTSLKGVRLILFFKVDGTGDAEALLSELWSHGMPFGVERFKGVVFLSIWFEGFSFKSASKLAEEKAEWIKTALRRAGFTAQPIEGWIEVESLLYAPLNSGWEAAFFTPCPEGWKVLRVSGGLRRKEKAMAVRRMLEAKRPTPHPHATLKSLLRREVLEVS